MAQTSDVTDVIRDLHRQSRLGTKSDLGASRGLSCSLTNGISKRDVYYHTVR